MPRPMRHMQRHESQAVVRIAAPPILAVAGWVIRKTFSYLANPAAVSSSDTGSVLHNKTSSQCVEKYGFKDPKLVRREHEQSGRACAAMRARDQSRDCNAAHIVPLRGPCD